MILMTEAVILCLLFFVICYLGTGTDEKNIKSYRSYPDAVQSILKADPKLRNLIPKASPFMVFISNVLMFSVILFVFGIFIRKETYLLNFLNILFLGELLNAFDFFVMDLMWFRNSKRTRFEGTKDQDQLYHSARNHFAAFLRGIPAFVLTAVIDGWVLSLI